jgi:hypothetical protein
MFIYFLLKSLGTSLETAPGQGMSQRLVSDLNDQKTLGRGGWMA